LTEVFNVGRALNQTFDLVRDNLPTLGLYVAAVGGVSAAGTAAGLISQETGTIGFNGGLLRSGDIGGFGFFLQLPFYVFGLIATYFLVAKVLQNAGRWQGAELRLLPYIGMSIISLVALVIGIFLLIVPGLIIATRWTPAAGFLISGRASATDCLRQSWDATSGHSWPIFFAGLALIVLTWLFSAISVAPLAFFSDEFSAYLLSSFVNAFTGGLLSVYGIAIYLLVTSGTEELEDVFS